MSWASLVVLVVIVVLVRYLIIDDFSLRYFERKILPFVS